MAELKMLHFPVSVTRLEKIRITYVRRNTQVNRFGGKVRESGLGWGSHVQMKMKEMYEWT